MAISYSISYTFSPSTTISSSQVNTNFSDNSNTWNGIEAKTKTFSNVGVDTQLKSGGTIEGADGTVAAPSITFTSNTATGMTISGSSISLIGLNGWKYRRPVLQYSSATVVNIETGINGTSGQAQILFPDGNLRQDSTTGRINCNLAQVAALSGSWQSGVRTGAVANNTWYAIYAVKTTDDTAKFVTVADTTLPTQANFATLNSNFGTNGWVYLGLIRGGDSVTASSSVLQFVQSGAITILYNTATAAVGTTMPGIRLATTAGATTLTYTYSAGTTDKLVPNNISQAYWNGAIVGPSATEFRIVDSANNIRVYTSNVSNTSTNSVLVWLPATLGISTRNLAGSSTTYDIFLAGWVDSVLGVGSNPIL